MPGRDASLALEVRRVRERPKAGAQLRGQRRRLADEVADAPAEGDRLWPSLGDQEAGALRRGAGGGHGEWSTMSGVADILGHEAVPVARLQLLLARLGGADVRRLGAGQQRAVRLVQDHALGGEHAAADLEDAALGADRPADRNRTLELHVHARGDAPHVVVDERPRHHLVEDRAQDAAVRDSLPAGEPVGQRHLRPAAIAAGVQVQVQAVDVERPAGEAVVRGQDDPAPPDANVPDDRGRVRRQGSAPCEPRS